MEELGGNLWVSKASPLTLVHVTVQWPCPVETIKNGFAFTFRVEKLTEVIADLRQPPMTDTTQIPASVEDSQFSSSNLSYLDLREDPDTLLR